VPRWLWPPPGAAVRRVVVRESLAAGAAEPQFEVVEGEWPEPLHLRALQWLLDDHVCASPPPGVAYEVQVLLEIASTAMAAGRVGHAYALDAGPLGAPAADGARGSLLRFTRAALRRPPGVL
jgi:hypothetical protein